MGNFLDGKPQKLRSAFDFAGLSDAAARASKLFVKPNFTFPRHIDGVTTSPAFLRDVLSILSDSGAEIFVGESNGGYGSFLAAEAFAGHGLSQICRETRATAVDLSRAESRVYERNVAGRHTSVRLPRLLAEEVDFTVSVPVLKVHAMTTVSLSVKNLWGCCPVDLRLLQHAQLPRKLRLIADLVKAKYGIVDGLYGLDGHGPMEGTSRYLGKFILGDDPYGLDWAAAKMMGFEPRTIEHLRLISPEVQAKIRAGKIESNIEIPSVGWNFQLGLNIIDVLSLAAFHSDMVAKIVFDSPLTRPIYAAVGRQPRRRLS